MVARRFRRYSGIARQIWGLVLPIGLGVPLLVGCSSGRVYRAANLPPQFMAPAVQQVAKIDFSRLAQVVNRTEVLQPGDLVEVSISTGIETTPTSWKLRIGDDGVAMVPLVGPVLIAGQDLTTAESIIRSESIARGKYVSPNVSLQVLQRRSNRVTVVGAVTNPGTYEIPAGQSDLLAALVAAGGLASEADTVVDIRYPPVPAPAPATAESMWSPNGVMPTSFARNAPLPPRFMTVDLAAINAGAAMPSLTLDDGSTVTVRHRGKRYIHVIGLVREPNQFEIPDDQDLRLLDALALARGRTLEIADKVHIVRQLPGAAEPIVIEASVRAAKRDRSSNLRLMAGDVVSVEETPLTFTVGTLRDFVRFGFSSALPIF